MQDVDIDATNADVSKPRKSYLASLSRLILPSNARIHQPKVQPFGKNEFERYRQGYPLFSSFLGRNSEFQNFRRFRSVRMRMLLLKQDCISMLERQLNDVDKAEQAELFLGNSRRDRNVERLELLEKLDTALQAYDNLLERSHWAINTPDAVPKDVESIKIWLENTGCIARDETGYLCYEDEDLLNIGTSRSKTEGGMTNITPCIEGVIGGMSERLRRLKKPSRDGEDDYIHISKPLVRGIARILIASLTILILLLPIIILNTVNTVILRFVVVFVSSTLFVSAVTALSKASVAEIFVSGATYAAVLVVFVSGNGISGG